MVSTGCICKYMSIVPHSINDRLEASYNTVHMYHQLLTSLIYSYGLNSSTDYDVHHVQRVRRGKINYEHASNCSVSCMNPEGVLI